MVPGTSTILLKRYILVDLKIAHLRTEGGKHGTQPHAQADTDTVTLQGDTFTGRHRYIHSHRPYKATDLGRQRHRLTHTHTPTDLCRNRDTQSQT